MKARGGTDGLELGAALERRREALEKTIAVLRSSMPEMPLLDDAWVEASYPSWLGTLPG